MFNNLKYVALALLGAVLFQAAVVSAADADKPVEVIKPDNTGVNERDRAPNEVTAGSQKQNKADIDITAKIRQAVLKDETLSTNARNVKIISIDGFVTLKGPVLNETEKVTIEKCAVAVAGENRVKNLIEVAP